MTVRKILHAADVHLDSPLQNLEAYPDAPVDAFRGATRQALANLVDLAIGERVDLVVIAGDLYDGDWDDVRTGLCFVEQALRLREAAIPLVVIRGNHDAALLMTRTLRLPDNPDGSLLMLDHQRVDQRVFESIGVAVHGRSFATRAVTEDLSRDYPQAIAGMFNLGLLHTCLTGSDGHENYAPTSPDRLARKGYDYWALGHIHDRRQCHAHGEAPIVFPGNTQGRHVRETGAKGCVILSIDPANQVTTEFHPLDVVRWSVLQHDAGDDECTDNLVDAFAGWLEDQLVRAEHRPLAVRVVAAGVTSLHDEYHRAARAIEDDLRSMAMQHGRGRVWFEQLRVRTQKGIASSSTGFTFGLDADSSDADSPYASLHHVLQQMRADSSAHQDIATLLKPLWDKLPGELIGDASEPLRADCPETISRWIDDAEPELVHRLQNEDGAA
jgi:DNA repair protein SbcD/Mre11